MFKTGREEKQIAEQSIKYHEGVPAITVVVDGGWSKWSHKHSYNANSGVGVTFGAATKKLLYISVRNKHCAACSIAQNTVHHHHNTCASKIGMAPPLLWKLTLLQLVSDSQKQCME